MRRGESRSNVSKADATLGRIALAPNDALRPSKAHARVSPVRVRLVRLRADTPAAHACSTMLALHGAAIAHNLQCVMKTLDPEGPHQLRIALRRTRVALRVFEPAMRGKVNARLVETARTLGGIAGELRDADVLIDEIIAPAARDEPTLMTALNAWRQEVRGRVRARLLAADAPAMAASFADAAARSEWLKRDGRYEDMSFAGLIAAAQEAFWERAAPLAARMADLSHLELHQLRKAAKALRYGAELGASAGMDGNVVPRLKRIQDGLGFANDTAALEQFNPPVFGEAPALQRIRARLIAERNAGVADAIATAMAEWRELARARAVAAH
jgi:triphosphatase